MSLLCIISCFLFTCSYFCTKTFLTTVCCVLICQYKTVGCAEKSSPTLIQHFRVDRDVLAHPVLVHSQQCAHVFCLQSPWQWIRWQINVRKTRATQAHASAAACSGMMFTNTVATSPAEYSFWTFRQFYCMEWNRNLMTKLCHIPVTV